MSSSNCLPAGSMSLLAKIAFRHYSGSSRKEHQIVIIVRVWTLFYITSLNSLDAFHGIMYRGEHDSTFPPKSSSNYLRLPSACWPYDFPTLRWLESKRASNCYYCYNLNSIYITLFSSLDVFHGPIMYWGEHNSTFPSKSSCPTTFGFHQLVGQHSFLTLQWLESKRTPNCYYCYNSNSIFITLLSSLDLFHGTKYRGERIFPL